MSLCCDNIVEICSHLERKDLYHLSLTSYRYCNLINFKQIIINTIKTRLQKIFENDYKDFITILNRVGGFIAGSFILQCILNEYWESDIDIFVPLQNLRKQGFDDGNMVTPLEYFLYEKNYDGNEDIQRYQGKDEVKIHKQIKRVRNYTKANKPVIQIISFDSNINYYKFISTWTDFDICKNLYSNGKLIINNINNIFNKSCQFNCTCLLEQSIFRYHKYHNRGFNITKIKYNELIKYDQYKNKIITNNLNNIPNTIKRYVDIKVKKVRPVNTIQCNRSECIIAFYDHEYTHSHCVANQKNYIIL